MIEETTYTIGRLAQAAGVTPRTIRYYTAEGLLPPPDTRGRYARYTESHLRRLQLIGRLKESFLPLSAIKTRLARMTEEEIRAALADEAPATEPASSETLVPQKAMKRPAPAVYEVFASPHEPERETWKRIQLAPGLALNVCVPLAPGVELHVRVPDSPEACLVLNRLIAETRALFKAIQ